MKTTERKTERETARKPQAATTLMREWLGAFACLVFVFCFGYTYDDYLADPSSPYPAIYFFVFVVSMGALCAVFGRRPGRLARIALFTTPAAVAIAIVMSACASPLYEMLYVALGALIAPAALRCVYGVVGAAGGARVAGGGGGVFGETDGAGIERGADTAGVFGTGRSGVGIARVLPLMSAFAAAVVFQSVWALAPFDTAVRFAIPAIFALVSFAALTRRAPEHTTQRTAEDIANSVILRKERSSAVAESSPASGSCDFAQDDNSDFIQSPAPRLRFSTRIAPVIIAFVLLALMDTASSLLHSFVALTGFTDENPMLWFIGMILPAIAFVVYAFLSDRGLQKVALVAGTLLYIVVLNLAFSASAFSGDGFFYTLGVADGFGGTFAEFAIISLPVLFLSDSRRPLFAASLGVTIDFLLAGILWLGPEWMPDALILSPGLQVLAFAVITSAAFLAVALYLTERTKEASLAQALAVFYAGAGRKRTRTPISEQVGKIAEGDTGAGTDAGIVVDANTDTGVGASMTAGAGADADMRAIPGMDMGAGANILVPDIFLPEEQQIAALVFEGFTKGEIARKLHMQSSDVANTIAKVRTKITGASESTDAGIFANAVKVYGLTNREAQILRGIYEGRTNAEMASLHFLSEATVKFHVRNVLRKLQVDGRVQVKDLLLSLADSGERSDH